MIKDYIKRCRSLAELQGEESNDPAIGFMAKIDESDDENVKKFFYLMTSVLKHADSNDKIRFKPEIDELMRLLK